MFRSCQRWQARYLLGRHSFHCSPILAKRVTHGTLRNVFDHSSFTRQDPTPSPPSLLSKSTSLEPRLACTGSVVLDTVREYTRKYPDCVLLMQVGDFYEVSIRQGSIYMQWTKGVMVISYMKHMHHNMHHNWI